MRQQEIDEWIIRCTAVAVHFCWIVVFIDVQTECIDLLNIKFKIHKQ